MARQLLGVLRPRDRGRASRGRRIPYRTVTGTLLDGDPAWDALREWLDAARAVARLRTARIGFLGHTYPGMLDMYSDFTQVHAQTGAHVEVLEIDDLVARVESADARGDRAEGRGDPARSSTSPTRASTRSPPRSRPRSSTGRRASRSGSTGSSTTSSSTGSPTTTAASAATSPSASQPGLIVGNSLLTARGVPAAGEGDLKTNIAMLLLDRLGAGGSYTEFYALDFDEEFILMGHDGPGHLAIADGRPVARALKLYHGKAGAGLSIEMKVRLGPVTILGVTQTADGRLKLIAAEGESIAGPTFRIGNTNSRIRFSSDPAAFFDAWCAQGPTHHVALGVGHQVDGSGRSPTCSVSS